jgi:PAS domain S-box-containing protein
MVLVDPDGVVLFANPAAVQMLDRDEAELLGAHLGVPVAVGESCEVQLPAGEAGFRVAEVQTAETTWEGKEACLCVLRDITEQKQAEETIRRERDRAELYLDTAGVMILSLDADGRIQLLNPRGAEILACGRADAIGKDWFGTFLPSDVRDKVRAVFHALMSGEMEGSEFAENTVLTATGEERTIRWHNRALRDADGTIVGTLSSGEDVTELKRARSEIRRFEWLLEQDTSPPTPVVPAYGDLTELNTERTILDSVGADTLRELATDAVALLDTSVAIYERNGDYAYGLFVSEWCGMLDDAGRKLCGTSDNTEALQSGECRRRSSIRRPDSRRQRSDRRREHRLWEPAHGRPSAGGARIQVRPRFRTCPAGRSRL